MEPSGTRNFPVRPLIIGIGIPVLLCALLGTKLLWARSADGPVITSIHLRTSPWSAALDERTGQLFVVNRAYGVIFAQHRRKRSAHPLAEGMTNITMRT